MDMQTTLKTRAEAEAAAETRAPRSFSTRNLAIGAMALAFVAGIGWQALHRPAQATIAPEVVLGVATPLASQVVQWDDYVGRFAPSQSVEVRPASPGRSPRFTSMTAIWCRRGSSSSPSTSAPIAPLWPRRRPMSPARPALWLWPSPITPASAA
jgi:hypothetical protein